VRNSNLKISGYLLIALVMVVSLAFSQSAEALQIRISDGINADLNFNDTDGDKLLATGIVSIGNYKLVSGLGKATPWIGTPTQPAIDLSGDAISYGSGGILKIQLTETGLTSISTIGGFLSSIGGTTDGSVNYDTYFDITNAAFGTGTLISHLGPLPTAGGPGFSGNGNSNTFPTGSPFSLTLAVTINHSASGLVGKETSFNGSLKTTPTPEPGTILLLGLGLLGLGIISKRKMEIEG